MNETTRKIIVEIAITKNLSKLKARFREGYNRAMYGNEKQIGLLNAYSRLQIYLPDSLWKNLSFPECMIFNTWIQICMLKLIGV